MILILALVSLAALGGKCNAQNAAAPKKTGSGNQAGQVGMPDQWPAAVREFWTKRAAETRLINGEYWSVKVLLEGQRLAESEEQALQDKALAYQQPGAPNYIRLRDGKQAMYVGDIASEDPKLTILEGRITSVSNDVITLIVSERPARIKKISGFPKQLRAQYVAMIKPFKEPQQPAKIITKMTPAAPGHEEVYTFVPMAVEPVTPEALRQACRELKVASIKEFRPIQTVKKPEFEVQGEPAIVLERRYNSTTYTRQDFTWFGYILHIPFEMR